MVSKLIFHFALWASEKRIKQEFGRQFYKDFVKMAKHHFKHVLSLTPDIGDSIFKLNFAFAPCYISWYKAFLSLEFNKELIIHWIWNMNEDMMLHIPQLFRQYLGAKLYLGGFRKKAATHETKSRLGTLPDYDFKIKYRPIDDRTFEIDIYQCGMKKLCEEYGAADLLPGICRIDYLIAHYMGCGFYRTKTLGDGDDVCNCRYSENGHCSWPMDKNSPVEMK